MDLENVEKLLHVPILQLEANGSEGLKNTALSFCSETYSIQ